MSELMQTMRSNQKTVEKKRERARHISQGSLLLVGGMLWVVSGGWVQAEPSPAPTQLPTGGQVVGGQASISQQSAVMTIQQQTNRAAIDWQSFDIGSQARVTFQQPSSSSVALNRVQGGNPSQIFGQLEANGQVFLSNPHGIVFGPSAHVEVGGLVATTHSLSLEDFMAGRDRFTREGATGTVVNEGELKAALGGYIALLAPEVRNQGVIVADMGTVALAAGEAYELHFDQGRQLTSLIVDPATIETLVDNQQAILAPGGLIILSARAADQLQGSVVRNDGIVNANSLVTRGGRIVLEGENLTQQGILTATGDTEGGEITLVARNTTYVDGLVDVSGSKRTGGTITVQAGKVEGMKSATFRANGEHGGAIHLEGQGTVGLSSTVNVTGMTQGGTIEVTGDRVFLLASQVEADGGQQGGTVHVGGGWQGGGDLAPARETFVGVGSRVTANATGPNGQGGEVVAWSQEETALYGTLSATGSAGQGGRIELSSKDSVIQGPKATLTAGSGGQVLLDPKNLTVTDSPPDSIAFAVKVANATGAVGMPTLINSEVFGSGLALDGDRLAVGARNGNTGGTNRGTVYLFTGVGTDFSGLTFEKKLASSTGATSMPALADNDNFGESVALSGDFLAVGATGTSSSQGAVHLFHGVGTDFSSLTFDVKLRSGAGATSMPTLSNFDNFGSDIVLQGDLLAVSAPTTGSTDKGVVYLFTGVGSDFSGLTYLKSLTTSTGALGMPALEDSHQFGQALAIDGDRFVVGAFDDADGVNRGAVHLFTGVGSDWSGLTYKKRLAGQAGASGMPVLANSDFFGGALGLDGDILVVGADGDNVSGTDTGAVYIFTGVGTDFSQLALHTTMRSGLGATGMPTLATFDEFGRKLALDGDRLAVGILDDTGGSNRGGVLLFTGLSSLPKLSDATFATNSSSTSFLKPSALTALLDVGTDVTLQANNDLTIGSAVTVSNGTGDGGDLTLQAGRNITFNANVTTDNGNLTAIAGDTNAISAQTDSGTPTLTIGSGVTLTTGSGVLALAAKGGNFVNNGGAGALSATTWQVWSTNPASNTIGGLVPDYKQYNATFGSTTVLGSGHGLLYSLAPTLTPSLIGSVSKSFNGTTAATLTNANYSVTGAVDGDTVTLNNPTSGTYDSAEVGTGKTVTVAGLGVSSATNGAASVFGYQVSPTTVSAAIGTITGSSSSGGSSTAQALLPQAVSSTTQLIRGEPDPEGSKEKGPTQAPPLPGVEGIFGNLDDEPWEF